MAKTARKASARTRGSEESLDATTNLDGASLTRRRIIWLVSAALYVVLLVSLASFSSSDWPTHVVASPTDPPSNLC